MNSKIVYLIVILFCSNAFVFGQEAKVTDKIGEKAVIGFPGITQEQLDLVAVELTKYEQIEKARFVYGDHNCMLLTFNQTKNFTVYAEFLKVLGSVYDIHKCYVKPPSAYDEIISNTKAGTEINLK